MRHRAKTETAAPKGHSLRHRHRTAVTTTPSGETSGLLLGVLLVAQLMVILDITAVNIALPSLARDEETGMISGPVSYTHLTLPTN